MTRADLTIDVPATAIVSRPQGSWLRETGERMTNNAADEMRGRTQPMMHMRDIMGW